MKHALVLGATSAIAQAFCRRLAPSGTHFWLLGRNLQRLEVVAADLYARGAAVVHVRQILPGSFVSLEEGIAEGFNSQGAFDLFFVAQGLLPSQEQCEAEPGSVGEVFRTNAVEVMEACLLVAARFEKQGRGTCVILGSVAGDRGRRSNYVYGAAKACLETFCEGLRQRLEPSCRVLLVKPGPVDTPMTSHFRKTALFSTPEKVAADIFSALRQGSAVCYTPFYWKWIMLAIRGLPRRVVKRLRA